MAKQCPISNTVVLYLDCQECEDRADCKRGTLPKAENIEKKESEETEKEG